MEMRLQPMIRCWALPSLLPLVLVAAGCTPDPPAGRPNSSEAYRDLLAEVLGDVGFDGNLALHPLLGQAVQGPGGSGLRVDAFNVEDTTVVRDLVRAHVDRFHLCPMTSLNSCDGEAEEVFGVLSELVEVAEGQWWVAVFVYDLRTPPGRWIRYTASIQHRLGSWRVGSVRRVR